MISDFLCEFERFKTSLGGIAAPVVKTAKDLELAGGLGVATVPVSHGKTTCVCGEQKEMDSFF